MPNPYADLGLPDPNTLGEEQKPKKKNPYADLGLPDPDELEAAPALPTRPAVPTPPAPAAPPTTPPMPAAPPTHEQKAQINIQQQEAAQRERALKMHVKGLFGRFRKDPKGLMRMYQMAGPRVQEEIRSYVKKEPGAFVTPPGLPKPKGLTFEEGKPRMRPYRPFELPTPTPEERRQLMQKRPPKIAPGTILEEPPMLKQAAPEPSFIGKLPVGGPVLEHVLGPTFEAVDALIFRNIGGAARGIQKAGEDYSKGRSLGDAAMGALETWSNSIRGIKPEHVMDVFLHAGRSIHSKKAYEDTYRELIQKGADPIMADKDAREGDLSTAQKIAWGGPGLIAELVVAGRMFPEFKGGVPSRNLQRQIEKVVKKSNIKGVQVDQESLFNIMTKKTFPEQVAAAEEYVGSLAKAGGVEPQLAQDLFRRVIGEQGKRFGQRMMKLPWPVSKEVMFPMARKVPTEGLVPFGAARTTGKLGRAGEEVGGVFSWGFGLPRGGKEAMRTAQAAAVGGERYPERAMMMLRGLGGEEEMVRLTKGLDLAEFKWRMQREQRPLELMLQETRDQMGRMAREPEQLTMFGVKPTGAKQMEMLQKREQDLLAQLAAKEGGYEVALKRAGVTDDEVLGILRGADPKQKNIMRAFREDLDSRFKDLFNEGVDFGYLEGMIPHIETIESKMTHPKMWSRRVLPALGKQMTKHRLPTEAGVALGGTPARTFEQRLGVIYAEYMRRSALLLANARAENAIIGGYGRLVTPEMMDIQGNILPKWKELMKQQGLNIYEPSIGHFKGQITKGVPKKYFIDSQMARFLNKTTNPSKMNKFVRDAEWFLNWWKARATIFRPGFMVRNVLFGNLYQQWLADVDIIPSNIAAARLQMYGKARDLKRYQGVEGTKYQRFVDRYVKPKKIGKYTADEVIDLAQEHKVIDVGFWGTELSSGATRGGRWYNPFSRGFAPMRAIRKLNTAGENNARLGTFIDKLKKGYTPEQAAAVVAKHLFNYDELTTFGQTMRQVFPFWTWTSKNWGLQLTTTLAKPGKLAQFARGFKGAQELDPLSPEDKLLEIYKPEWMVGTFRVPGVRFPNLPGSREMEILGKRPKGARGFIMTTTLMPPTAMMEWIDPKEVPRALGNMLHPWLKAVVEQAGFAPQMYHRRPFMKTWEDRRLAPGWATWLMDAADKMGIRGVLENFFRPIRDPKEYLQKLGEYRKTQREHPDWSEEELKDFEPAETVEDVFGYTWPSWFDYALRIADPAFATVNRIIKQNRGEESINELLATIAGLKIFPYGQQQATAEYIRKQTTVQEWINTLWTNLLKHGEMIDKKRPYRMYWPKQK